MSYGQKTHVALSFQNSWDTANVSSLYHIQHIEESVGLNIPPLKDGSARGVFDEGDSYQGPRTVDGDFIINAKSIPLGVLCRGYFGAATVTQENSASVFNHVFKSAQADFDEFSAHDPMSYFKYMDDGGSASLFYNLNIGAMEFGAENGEFLTAKASFVGGKFSQNADIAASYPTGKRFTWDVSSLQINGVTNGNLKALSIVSDDSLEPMHTINNSPYPSHVLRSAERVIEVSGTIIFKNQTEWQKFIAGTEQPFKASFGGVTAISSGYIDEIILEMPALRYSEFKPVGAGPGKTEVGFTAEAKYHTGSATALQVTLTNTQAVY